MRRRSLTPHGGKRPEPFATPEGPEDIAEEREPMRYGVGSHGSTTRYRATRLVTARPLSPLRLIVFGGPLLEGPVGSVPLSPLQGILLGVLSAHGQRGMRRDDLLSFLWSEGPDLRLRKRLSQLVYSLHQRVRRGLIEVRGATYVLRSAGITTDLEEFLVLVGRREPEKAVDLVTRGFLSGLDRSPTWELEHWIDQRDFRFRSEARTMATECWSEGEQRADWKMARSAAEAWLRLDPHDEAVFRRLLQAMALGGRVREAEARYAEYREMALADDPEWEPEDPTARTLDRLQEMAARGGERIALQRAAVPQEPPLIGRADELRRLTELIRDPASGRVTTVLVLGESGIGKTRLVREALSRAPFDGIRVLQGTCSDFEHAIPLNPIIRSLSPDWIGRAIQDTGAPWDSLLLSLLPELWPSGSDGPPRFPGPTEEIPNATREALRRLLSSLAESDPIAFFLDDFHWIDTTSLSLLAYVRERWRGPGLSLIVALRPEEVKPGSPLAQWLDVPARDHGGAVSIELGPLHADDVRDLLVHAVALQSSGLERPKLPEDQIDALVELVDGHPFLALESIRGWPSAGVPDAPTGSTPVSDAIRAIVYRRVTDLSEDAQVLLSSLSVSEKPLPLSVVEAASGLDPERGTRALDDVCRKQFLVVSPRGIGFRHALVRDAVVKRLTSGRRVATHRRLAEALIALLDPTLFPDIALHLFAAAEPHRAAPYVIAAAHSAIATGGWTEARALLELALESGPRGETRGEISALLGRLMLLSGEFQRAEELWTIAEDAFRRAGKEEDALLAQLRVIEAQRLQPQSDREDLLYRVRALRTDSADRDFQRVVAECLNAEVRMLDSLSRTAEVRGLTSVAREHVHAGDLDTHLQFLFVSMLEAVYGEPEKAARVADDAIRLASEHGRDDLLLKALNWKIIAYYHQARLNLPEGVSLVKQARRVAAASADPDQKFWLEGNVGAWQVEVGDHTGASRSFDRADQALGSLLAPHRRRNLLFNRGQLALELGQAERAKGLFEESLTIGEVSEYAPHRCVTLAGLGLTYLLQGSVSEAEAVSRELPAKPHRWTYDPFLWLAFEAKLGAMQKPVDALLVEMNASEVNLKETVPTAWMRLRILRFEVMLSNRRHLPEKELREIELFLEERRIDKRLEELRALTEP